MLQTIKWRQQAIDLAHLLSLKYFNLSAMTLHRHYTEPNEISSTNLSKNVAEKVIDNLITLKSEFKDYNTCEFIQDIKKGLEFSEETLFNLMIDVMACDIDLMKQLVENPNRYDIKFGEKDSCKQFYTALDNLFYPNGHSTQK